MKEIDAISASVDKYTNAHTKNIMQIAVFKLDTDNYYGININKINYFAMTKDLEITKMSGTKYVIGYFNFDGNIIAMVNLAQWLHSDVDVESFSRAIICEFSGTQVAFLVSEIYKIYDKSASELEEVSSMKDQVTYATKIDIEGKKDRLCMILDVENLYTDINPDQLKTDMNALDNYTFLYDKTLLIAEDSRAIQTYIKNIFSKFDTSYNMFNNGKKLIDFMEEHPAIMKDINVVITDIEMPIMDGFQVIKYIKSKPNLAHVRIIVHTSMSNEFVNTKVKSLGAHDFVKKMNPVHLLESIKKYDKEGDI